MGLISRIRAWEVLPIRGAGVVWLTLLLIAVAAGQGLATKDLRPMHSDEAGNAVTVGQALEGSSFVYDATDRHGPTWFVVAELVSRATGARDVRSLEEWQVRLPSLLAWLSLLLTLPWWGRVLSAPVAVLAGLWWACAAPMVYYGGYAIHEPLLGVLTMLAWLTGAAWLSAHQPSVRLLSAGILGGVIGTGLATKETAILSLGAALVAVVVGLPMNRVWMESRLRCGDLVVMVVTLLVVVMLWFSDGARHPERLRELLGVWSGISTRAAGAGHQSPWYTYGDWFMVIHARHWPWSGWLLSVGFIPGAWLAWRQRDVAPLPWMLTVYVASLAVIYAAIPYKTPWLMVQVMVPGALVAAAGWMVLGRAITRGCGMIPAVVLGAAALLALAHETRQLVLRWPVDPANPLAYAHTVPDCLRLAERIARQASEHPGPVAVIGPDPWPLPWYLRRCPAVGYWPAVPGMPSATNFTAVVALPGASAVEAHIPADWTVRVFGLRPDVVAQLYLPAESP